MGIQEKTKVVEPHYWQYAHIYNRGVDRRTIFNSDRDYRRFMMTMRIVLLKKAERVSMVLRKREKLILSSIKQAHLLKEFGPPIVDIIAFCLMPNHFHIVIRAAEQEDIAKFAQRLGNSYTLYFNTRHTRKGRLFESKYQIVPVKTDEQLIHVVRYVHTNPANSQKMHLNVDQLKEYQWSSLPAYLKGESKMCSIDVILSHFSSVDDFWRFTKAGINCSESLPNELLIDAS